MQDQPLESDWKAFRRMVPEWRERYLEGINAEIRGILDKKEGTATEVFWEAEERARKEAKVLRGCLDGHRRSRMLMFLFEMYRHGMITEADLGGFSEELRERIEGFKGI